MNLRLSVPNKNIKAAIAVTGSKSESNRLLILQALFPQLEIENLSNSDDTEVLQKALRSSEKTINIGHAGTAMRFLTAYFSTQKGKEIILTGSKRMQERPIRILVDALRELGADIAYENEEGFPPLRIRGKELIKSKVGMQANVSSQYISALMLIAPSLPNGLEIDLESEMTSIPYLEMTAALLEEIGVNCNLEKKKIQVFPVLNIPKKTMIVESDWSSASYFYSAVALSESANITLGSYKKNSLQGDAAIADIYKEFGVTTDFSDGKITLKKVGGKPKEKLTLNLMGTPDIAQTLVVTCLGLRIHCNFTGLHTLKIKETDRLVALKTELEKFGAKVMISDDTLEMFPPKNLFSAIDIDTYNDHRMAMAFAPLALTAPIQINDAEVVSKSYPSFWEDMKKLGFQIEKSDNN